MRQIFALLIKSPPMAVVNPAHRRQGRTPQTLPAAWGGAGCLLSQWRVSAGSQATLVANSHNLKTTHVVPSMRPLLWTLRRPGQLMHLTCAHRTQCEQRCTSIAKCSA